MNCEECAENLTSLVFDELPEEKSLKMHEHIADCDDCREKYMDLIVTQSMLEESLTEKLSVSGLSDSQKEKIQDAVGVDNEGLSKPPIVFPAWLLAAAACLIIGVIVFKNSNIESVADMAKTENEPAAVSEAKAKKPGKREVLEDAKPSIASNTLEEAVEDAPLVEKSEDKENAPVKQKLRKKTAIKRTAVPKALKEESKEAADASDSKKAKVEFAITDKLKKMDQTVLAEAEPEEKLPAKNEELEKDKEIQNSVFAGDELSADEDAAVVLDYESFVKMLNAYSKTKGQSKDASDAVSKMKSLKKDQIQFIPVSEKNTKNDGTQKILIRILDNAKKALDYAHIFVHNQNIIRVERVR